jgi:enoyl-CoA hydratase/carnithine racemase
MADDEPVRREVRGAALWITIDRPTSATRSRRRGAEIACGLVEAQANEAVRAIGSRARGRPRLLSGVFKSGGDGPFQVDPARPRNAVVELPS